MRKVKPRGVRTPRTVRRRTLLKWSAMSVQRAGGMVIFSRGGIGDGGAAFGGAEEEFFERGVVADVGEGGAGVGDGAEEEGLTVMQDQQVCAEILDEGEQVRADDDGCAGSGALADGIFHGANAVRIQAGEGLVEEDGFGVVEVGAADGDFLAHAAGEFLGEGVSVGREFELIEERFGGGLEVVDAVGAGDELKMFPDGEGVEKFGVVGDVGEEAFGGDGVAGEVMAGDE